MNDNRINHTRSQGDQRIDLTPMICCNTDNNYLLKIKVTNYWRFLPAAVVLFVRIIKYCLLRPAMYPSGLLSFIIKLDSFSLFFSHTHTLSTRFLSSHALSLSPFHANTLVVSTLTHSYILLRMYPRREKVFLRRCSMIGRWRFVPWDGNDYWPQWFDKKVRLLVEGWLSLDWKLSLGSVGPREREAWSGDGATCTHMARHLFNLWAMRFRICHVQSLRADNNWFDNKGVG